MTLVALVMAACGSPASTSQASSATARATPTPTPQPISASALLDKLKAGGLPIAKTIVFTASSDTNSLLGRPHQYSGKATWQDARITLPGPYVLPSGVLLSPPPSPYVVADKIGLPWPDVSDGGSIESFATSADLQTRVSYVTALTKQPSFAEYDYSSVSGLFFLRLSGQLTPDQTTQYVQAVKAWYPDLKSAS